MKKHTHLCTLLLVLLALVLLLASCSASTKADGGAMEDVKNELYGEEIAPGVGNTGKPDTDQEGTDLTDASNRKIIKTFEISAETKDYPAAIEALDTLIAQYGGYVESSSSTNKSLKNSSDTYTRHASYTIRIPAEQADAFVGSMGNMLNVTNTRSFVEDVSETYYSIEARLEELLAERDSLIDILDTDKTKQDYQLWLTVTQRLSEIRQQIAVYQGQLDRYDSKVAYSTVHLNINEVIAYSATGQDNRFGSRLQAAFSNGWNGFVIGLGNFAIWFAEALPTLLLLGGLATGIFFFIRAQIRKKKRKKSEQTRDQ
ncbi:MAG: DUF4349 domain-containing protein [Clostridia bacterium]|nr:DUF4349 domain-containing protein [Clostridia bacterium]